MKLLDALINKFLCTHEWTVTSMNKYFGVEISSTRICKKCGKIKRYDFFEN